LKASRSLIKASALSAQSAKQAAHVSLVTPFNKRLRTGILLPMAEQRPPEPVIVAPKDGKKYNLRFPEGMRERIAAAAEERGESINTEILTRLESSFRADAREQDRAFMATRFQAIEDELAQLRELIEKLVKQGK
jgi:hypothetical protein